MPNVIKQSSGIQTLVCTCERAGVAPTCPQSTQAPPPQRHWTADVGGWYTWRLEEVEVLVPLHPPPPPPPASGSRRRRTGLQRQQDQLDPAGGRRAARTFSDYELKTMVPINTHALSSVLFLITYHREKGLQVPKASPVLRTSPHSIF